MSIVVVGSVFVDIKGYPSRTYIPGGRNAGKVRYVHGGVSRNIAEDLGNLGLEPVFLSLVDPNGVGEDVLLRLREEGTAMLITGPSAGSLRPLCTQALLLEDGVLRGPVPMEEVPEDAEEAT